MKRVIVTGATSMIGVALIEECVKNNVEVLAIAQRGSKKLQRIPHSDLVTVCLCDLDEIGSGKVGEGKYDVFYHFAWGYTAKATRDNPTLQAKNIQYTLDAVELARKLGCEKFIGAGSQAEYGIVHEVIDGKTKVAPVSSYGISKYAAGRLSAKLCEQLGLIHIWTRIFSVYGTNDSEETMLSYAVRQFLRGERAYFSAATQYWDFLYEEDAGKIFYLLGEMINENKVYRVANGNFRPLKEFILELKELFEGKAECEFAKTVDIENTVNLRVDVSDLLNDIKYKPQISFKDGAQRLISFWKAKEEGGSQEVID